MQPELYKKVEEQHLLFQDELSLVKKEILKSKDFFLSKEFFDKMMNIYDDGGHGTVNIIYELTRYYKRFCLFKDEEIIGGFKRFGLTDNHLRWFIEIDDFMKEIDKINQSGFMIIPHKIIFDHIYNLYYPSKIRISIAVAYGFTKEYDGKEKLIPAIELHKYYQNRKNREGQGNNIDKTIMDNFYSWGHEFIDNRKDELGIQNKYNTEKIIKDLHNGTAEYLFFSDFCENFCVIDEGVSESKVLATLFDFFKLILKDKEWKSEDEFNDDLEIKYDESYNRYKAITLKKFLYKV